MPFYEYQCKNCGHTLEAMQKISESPLKKCPHCGKAQLQRLMSAPVFRLKGGGWYETDFKGDSDNKRNLADRPEADAPKDAAKDSIKDSGDTKSADAKSTETAAVKESTPAPSEKAADKPAAKTATSSARKNSPAKAPARPKRAVKKAAAKAKGRR